MTMTRDEAPISTPCGADWKTMAPRGTSRLCATCDKLVHNLSAMSERDARALLHTRPHEGLCIRYLHDADGAIWFGDQVPGRIVPARHLVRRTIAMATAAALLVAPVLTQACGGGGPDPNPYSAGGFGGDDASAGEHAEPDARVLAHATVGSEDAGPDAPGDARQDAAATTDVDTAGD
jgi:hypothetical protein